MGELAKEVGRVTVGAIVVVTVGAIVVVTVGAIVVVAADIDVAGCTKMHMIVQENSHDHYLLQV